MITSSKSSIFDDYFLLPKISSSSLYLAKQEERVDMALWLGTFTPLVTCTTYKFVDTQFVQDPVDQSGKTCKSQIYSEHLISVSPCRYPS